MRQCLRTEEVRLLRRLVPGPAAYADVHVQAGRLRHLWESDLNWRSGLLFFLGECVPIRRFGHAPCHTVPARAPRNEDPAARPRAGSIFFTYSSTAGLFLCIASHGGRCRWMVAYPYAFASTLYTWGAWCSVRASLAAVRAATAAQQGERAARAGLRAGRAAAGQRLPNAQGAALRGSWRPVWRQQLMPDMAWALLNLAGKFPLQGSPPRFSATLHTTLNMALERPGHGRHVVNHLCTSAAVLG